MAFSDNLLTIPSAPVPGPMSLTCSPVSFLIFDPYERRKNNQ